MLRLLTRAESGGAVFAAILALYYGALPLAVHLWAVEGGWFGKLALLGLLGAAGVLLGSRLPWLDGLHREERPRLAIPLESFLLAVWGAFGAFVLVACITADRIPFVAALQGADAETLSTLREQFLKAREGWQASFVYVNAVLAGALVPYSIVRMLLRRHHYRWVCFALFLLYCLSFVEKVFFLKAVIPLAYVVIQRRITSVIRPEAVLAGAVGLLALGTLVTGAGTESGRGGDDFFSTSFAPEGPAAFIAWRAVAVPILTGADTLRVFEEEYGGRPLWGASSTVLAALFGLERVAVERDVYAAQWGQNETETGNANAVFLTEAYLNFGYPGVVAFSLLVGLILRLFARSRDEALRSLWMLFCFATFVAPLTGTLFSNGFLLVIALSVLVRFEEPGDEGAALVEPAG